VQPAFASLKNCSAVAVASTHPCERSHPIERARSHEKVGDCPEQGGGACARDGGGEPKASTTEQDSIRAGRVTPRGSRGRARLAAAADLARRRPSGGTRSRARTTARRHWAPDMRRYRATPEHAPAATARTGRPRRVTRHGGKSPDRARTGNHHHAGEGSGKRGFVWLSVLSLDPSTSRRNIGQIPMRACHRDRALLFRQTQGELSFVTTRSKAARSTLALSNLR
jgi:hypothetical protein